MRETTKILTRLSMSSGKDFRDIFCDMLDFFIDTFDMNNLMKHHCDMVLLIQDAKEKNADFCECLTEWAVTVNKEMAQGRCHDFFGAVYEEEVKSAYKAAKLGQFFTPVALCDVCAKIIMNKDAHTVNDPTCGSGRLLLSAFQDSDKSRFNYFVGEDLDSVSVKMCALNMMMNGMFGHVVCHDTLRQDFHFAYAINELQWPFPSGVPSIRKLTQQQYESLAARHMSGTTIEHPVEEAEEKAARPEPPKEEPKEKPKEEPKEKPRKEPVQLNLFANL